MTREPEQKQMTSEPLGAAVQTKDGTYTLRHPEHDECYHSHIGARAEAEHLYVFASGYAEKVCASVGSISILDVGLGLAYNALATISEWMASEGKSALNVTSLESNEALVRALSGASASWQVGWSSEWLELCRGLQQSAEGIWVCKSAHPKSGKALMWTVLIGDALDSLASLPEMQRFDYVWQDPFSPQKNPRMWSAEWFSLLRKHVYEDSVLVSYSVARVVKDALTNSGWTFRLIATSGGKRSWLRAEPKEV